jgi:putative addiction module component (TIGR02574 family)
MTSDFDSILDAAQALPAHERVRLIDVLWDTVPVDAEIPLHTEWEAELERRVTALKSGTAKTVPWTSVRQAALERIGHGTID